MTSYINTFMDDLAITVVLFSTLKNFLETGLCLLLLGASR
jgi:hypothetical protein